MAREVEDDLTPPAWNMTRTANDSMVPVTFGDIVIDGAPAVITDAVAQVRVAKSSTSTLVLDLEATHTADSVTVGDNVTLDDIAAGVYHWDCQVVTDDYPYGVTIVGGTFRVLNDVSEEEGS